MLTFGVTVLPDPPHTRFLELMQLAEANHFDNGWTYDSHILWHDGYPLLTLLATQTEKLKFGHCVTNPGTREPTVTASCTRRCTPSRAGAPCSGSGGATRPGG